jgi:outer membrane usher protein
MSTTHFIQGTTEAVSGIRMRRLSLVLIMLLGSAQTWANPLSPISPSGAMEAAPATADPGYVEFSGAFIGTERSNVDISRFEKGNPVLPGTYRVDIFVNDARIAREDVVFQDTADQKNAKPCFTYPLLQQMGVDVSKLPSPTSHSTGTCIAISEVSPDAQASMDVGELRLDVSIPQVALKRSARGYVSPELWDQGETAFLLGYTLNAYSFEQDYQSTQSPYGSAQGIDGSRVAVQDGTYYALAPNGSYVTSPTGSFALSPSGTYVPVRNGTYVAPQTRSFHASDANAFLGLNMGFNVAGWRLRSQETATWDQRTGRTRWNNIGTTATHDVTPLKAQFTIGDGYTQGMLFDTTPFRGLTLYTDDRMLPDSQTGYAPVVRGVANTQARVEVRQSGNLIYETTVAPGPFVISDLYATGYGGDLTVIVREADGTTRSFAVPYGAVPMLLRPGMSRWAITDGQVRDTALIGSKPYFLEGTYQRGINNWLTAYGGVQTTYRNLYHAYLGGVAVNTPVGAVSLDVTNSRTNLHGWAALSGYSARLTYSKAIPSTHTTFALASYRYSNGNYMALSEAITTQDRMSASGIANPAVGQWARSRQRLQVTLNQNFAPGYGSLYFTGSYNTFWNIRNDATTYQFGYNNNFRSISIGVTASRTYSSSPAFAGRRYDSQLGLNLSIPLGGASMHTPMLTASAVRDVAYGNDERVGINGNFGSTNQFSYGANVSYAESGGNGTTAGGNIGWQAPYANLNLGYSYASRYQQASAGASGGLVIHPGGITLSPQLDPNSAIGIVQATDAKGARISSSGQAKVDGRGYAVATSLMPYRMNDVTLDPTGTSTDVELQTTRLQTAPRAGAVVPLKFDTVSGRVVLIRAHQANGDPLPFGAQITDEQGHDVGSVAQGSQMFVRGGENGGSLVARWGDGENEQCRVHYVLPARSSTSRPMNVEQLDASCD